MAIILRMPEVLANTTHAVLETWAVAEGDAVTTGDLLAEIETEKALVELNAEADGVLYRQLVASGDDVEVGAPIAVLAQAGETGIDIPALLGGEEVASAEPAEPAPASQVAYSETKAAAAYSEPTAGTAAASGDGARRFASPLVRRMAREQHLDLATLTGTGPGGRIVRRDVESFLSSRPAAPEPAPATRAQAATPPTGASGAGYVEVPHTRMRQAIARRLTESKSTVPHFYLTADCRVDALLDLRRQINESSPVKISVNDFVVKAVAAAFTAVPEATVTWDDAAMRQYSQVDISIAVATDGGLVTPVLRNVAARSLSDVSAGIAELAQRARTGRLRQDELEGGSFAVTNLGMFGTREFSAILNPPQSGILAVGAAQRQPVVDGDTLVVGTVMRCTLSVDHRAIDGVLAARWLAAFTSSIENPLSILI